MHIRGILFFYGGDRGVDIVAFVQIFICHSGGSHPLDWSCMDFWAEGDI